MEEELRKGTCQALGLALRSAQVPGFQVGLIPDTGEQGQEDNGS